MPHQPVDEARLARWEGILGAHRFVHDIDGGAGESWRLIGLNTEIMGSGLPAEAAQQAFLATALAGAGSRRIAAFLHKPAFLGEPSDPRDYWSVPPEARPALAALLHHPGLRLVASGHLHLYRQKRRGDVLFTWAPPASFVCEVEFQGDIPGERVAGFLLHRLGIDSVETSLVSPIGIKAPFLEDVRAEAYPRSG